jgi:predicted  nucleic acid-binding Zn-ribbon protein
MPGPALIFRDVHRLRRFLNDLQEQIDRVPRQKTAQQMRVKKQEDLQHQTQEAIKHLKVEAHSKEVTLRTTHGQIAKYEKQLNEAASKKEYDALQSEIKQAQAHCQQLEDEILTCISDSEEKTAQLPELEKAIQDIRQEYARFEQTANERLADLERQKAEAQQQLAEAEAQLPDNVKQSYQRVLAAHGADALAPVRNRSCSACYTAITAQSYNDLQQHLFVLCKSCGRVLYLPE